MTRALIYTAVFIALLLVSQAVVAGMTQCSIAPLAQCPRS